MPLLLGILSVPSGEACNQTVVPVQEAAGQTAEEGGSENEGGEAQGSPSAKEGTSGTRVTDQELMGCVKPEEIWKKISKKAAEGVA